MSSPGGGWADNGPGVLPLPGDRASSFIAPPYDNEELGGLCWTGKKKKKKYEINYLKQTVDMCHIDTSIHNIHNKLDANCTNKHYEK